VVNLFLDDVIATVVVWSMGMLLRSASLYDPYWSMQSVILYLAMLIYYQAFTLGTLLYLGVLILYTLRLTGNFVWGFNNLTYVDWRYRMLKEKTGKAYPLVNLLGICLLPTCLVFLGTVPLIQYVSHGLTFSYYDLIGESIMLGSVILELLSDLQMKSFIRQRKDHSEVNQVGLWAYSRHPNYFGEVSFWYGVALVFLLNSKTEIYWITGAILITLLFLFISIPMEEKHMLSYKPSYLEYQQKTSVFLILPHRK
jgi:steroid 5-alpha reductase family enzyme